MHTYLVVFDVAAPKEGIYQYWMKLLQNKKILNETIKGWQNKRKRLRKVTSEWNGWMNVWSVKSLESLFIVKWGERLKKVPYSMVLHIFIS
jgi:hypothetical protein